MISDTTRYHEAGHAIGSLMLGVGLDDLGIEINSDEDACTHIRVPDEHSTKDPNYFMCRAATKLSGPAAQLRFENRPFTEQEVNKDHRTAQDLKEAKMILQQYSTNRHEQTDDALHRQLSDAGTIAHNLVASHWSEVEAIVAATKETGCLNAEKVRSIVGPPKSFTYYLSSAQIDRSEPA